MVENEGQFSRLNQIIEDFDTYVNQFVLDYGTDINDRDNTINIPDEVKDLITQKKEEFFIDIVKLLCISILCGDYICVSAFFTNITLLEKKIQELPNKTNDFPPDIQYHIFDICSALVVMIEYYKDFYKKIENYYSEDRVHYLFQRNTLIQKELNKDTLHLEKKRIISFYVNLINVSSIDHFPSTADKYIIDIFNAENFLENFSNPSFRDIKMVIEEKIKFLKYKWRERRIQENPLIHNYLENGIHKQIEECVTTNEKLNEWKSIINTQYELTSNWKIILTERVKTYKADDFDSINNILNKHQLVKYYKDVNHSNYKLNEFSKKLITEKLTSDLNKYDKYARNVFCNYVLNNEFSSFLLEEMSIEKINKKYDEISLSISDVTSNYFLKYKFLNKIFDLLIPKINTVQKDLFIREYQDILLKAKQILDSYRDNIEWSLRNFNYIFLLPFDESKAVFKIDNVEYDIFFPSSFVLPPSSKNIQDNYLEIKEKFDKLHSYLDFSKYFSSEIEEIKTIKKELDSKEIKSVELLSLFTAVISFVIGGVSGFAFIKDLYTALLFFVVFTTSLLTFLIALFVFTRGKKVIKENLEYIKILYAIFFMSILLLFGSNMIKVILMNNETAIQKINERLKNDSIKNSSIAKPNNTLKANTIQDTIKKNSTPQK